MPREFLPSGYAHLPVLGTVRNPWAFYVSWYHYVSPKHVATKFVSWMSENGRLGVTGSIRNLLNLGVNDKRLDVLIDMLPEHIDYSRRHIPNVTKGTMRKVCGTGVGYYTFRFNEMFGDPDDVFFCRVETLRQDLIDFFEGIRAASDELRDYVLRLDKKNISEHLHYSTYYTPELAKLVSMRDRALIERFGYVFEQACSVENEVPNASIETPATGV
jgi:hypothetical protein